MDGCVLSTAFWCWLGTLLWPCSVVSCACIYVCVCVAGCCSAALNADQLWVADVTHCDVTKRRGIEDRQTKELRSFITGVTTVSFETGTSTSFKREHIKSCHVFSTQHCSSAQLSMVVMATATGPTSRTPATHSHTHITGNTATASHTRSLYFISDNQYLKETWLINEGKFEGKNKY